MLRNPHIGEGVLSPTEPVQMDLAKGRDWAVIQVVNYFDPARIATEAHKAVADMVRRSTAESLRRLIAESRK